MKQRLSILGSTGSIGVQTLDIVRENPDLFEITSLTARSNWQLLARQAIEFDAACAVITDPTKYEALKSALASYPIKVFTGEESLRQVVCSQEVDVVVNALVGYAGLVPTVAAIKAGKKIALANKETLVVGGDLVMRLAAQRHVPILPIDSEHSAIFQCLAGEHSPVRRLIITCSGGALRDVPAELLPDVTPERALKHPQWRMGAKITIDSASMMNKGFEMIEAKWLFGVTPEQIQIVVHPQSVIHSMVQFEDGAVMAQLGIPDMKLPISYAFSYPKRLTSKAPRLDFNLYSTLTFEEPDMTRFRNLAFAFDAIRTGGNMPCILNAANEVVVAAFLRDEIGFLQMSDVIEKTMATSSFIATPTYEDYVATDAEARRVAASVMNTIAGK